MVTFLKSPFLLPFWLCNFVSLNGKQSILKLYFVAIGSTSWNLWMQYWKWLRKYALSDGINIGYLLSIFLSLEHRVGSWIVAILKIQREVNQKCCLTVTSQMTCLVWWCIWHFHLFDNLPQQTTNIEWIWSTKETHLTVTSTNNDDN